jgi:hypothetical protein
MGWMCEWSRLLLGKPRHGCEYAVPHSQFPTCTKISLSLTIMNDGFRILVSGLSCTLSLIRAFERTNDAEALEALSYTEQGFSQLSQCEFPKATTSQADLPATAQPHGSGNS